MSARSTPSLHSRWTHAGTRLGDATPPVGQVSAASSVAKASSSAGFIVCLDLLALTREDVIAMQRAAPLASKREIRPAWQLSAQERGLGFKCVSFILNA